MLAASGFAWLAQAAGPQLTPPQQPLTRQQEAAPAEASSDAATAVPPPPQTEQAAPVKRKVAHFRPVRTHLRPGSGMVRYDRPVFHNGHLVLWHGAWRTSHGGFAEAASRVGPPEPAPRPETDADASDQATPKGETAASRTGDLVILADAGDAAASRMASDLARAMQAGGLRIQAVAGKTSAAALDKAASADAADLAVAPLDSLIDEGKAAGEKNPLTWRARIPYLLRLSTEPIELIAPRAIADIAQLNGRKVNVGAPGGVAATTAALVFPRLNVAPAFTNEDLPEALTDLTSGLMDGVFVVGGNASKALAEFGKDGRFHVVAIPYAPALQALYSPMQLTRPERPNLIGADEQIDTIGVRTALVAIDAPPQSPRAARLSPVATLLFSRFDGLFGASDNSDLRDVNLAARLPDWPRLEAAQAWLDQNAGAPDAAVDAFRELAKTAAAGSHGPTAADSDQLYQRLILLDGPAR